MVRLATYIPVLIILFVIFIIVYLVVAHQKSPNRAKELSIRTFLVITIVVAAFFGLCSLYAWSEHNKYVLELTLSCMFIGVGGLIITIICRAVFLHHHPDYKHKPMKTHNINSFWDNMRNNFNNFK